MSRKSPDSTLSYTSYIYLHYQSDSVRLEAYNNLDFHITSHFPSAPEELTRLSHFHSGQCTQWIQFCMWTSKVIEAYIENHKFPNCHWLVIYSHSTSPKCRKDSEMQKCSTPGKILAYFHKFRKKLTIIPNETQRWQILGTLETLMQL